MKLTELEGAALGLLWLGGTTTAYELRKMVADSPTPQWSASAGTVYPLVEKLGKNRLVAFSSTGDGRRTRRLRITAAGRRAFRQWMLDCSPAVMGVPPDPVRTRVRFLELLSAADESRLLAGFEQHLKGGLTGMRAVRRGVRSQESLGEALTLFGARLSQENRIEWVAAARKLAKRSRRTRTGGRSR